MSILNEALDAIPGHREAKTAVDTVKTWRPPQIITTGAERRRIAIELAAAARAGQDLPADIAERLATDERKGAQQGEVARLIGDTLAQLQGELNHAVTEGIGHGYRYLHDRLDELCTEVRSARDTLAALAHVDADTAIRTQQVTQWQQAEQLTDRYTDLRHAHFVLVGMESPVQRHLFAVSGQLVDPCDVDPYWITRRMYNSGRTNGGITSPDYRRHVDWLTAAHGRGTEDHYRSDIFPSTMPRLAWLITVADNTPWVPTADQIINAHALEFTATGADLDAAQARAHMTTQKETANA